MSINTTPPMTILTAEKQPAKVLKYTTLLCEALRQNFIEYSIRRHEFMMPSAERPEYYEEQIAKLKDGICDYEFTIEPGRKYLKIVMTAHGGKSVHAFVDKNNGNVYKAASFKSPAARVRYNLLDDVNREQCYQQCDWSGGYLYMR
tara:strand:+ start:86 stop:523 length:438 start_codon:yes stop_codon:yes gene_type:complete